MDYELLVGVMGSPSPGRGTGLQDHRERGRNLPDGFGFIYFRHVNVEAASSHEVVDT
jgi:hypothetical protein